MSLEGIKNPDSPKEEISVDIIRKTRFTRIESPPDEPPRIHFYERVPEKGGVSLGSVEYNSSNNDKYHPAPQEVPPYSSEELEKRKTDLHAQLDAMRGQIDPAVADELGKRIDEHDLPRSLNVVEDDIFVASEQAERRAGAEKDAAVESTEKVPDGPARPTVEAKGKGKGKVEKSEASKEPPPPPIEERPLSDRVSGVRSPFSIRAENPEPLKSTPHGKDAYVPGFIQHTLRAEVRGPIGAPPTMREILQDPKKQEQFGMVITAIAGDEGAGIVKKFLESESNVSALTEDDQKKIEHYRIEFQRRALLLDEMKGNTTPADLEFVLKNDPAFTFLRNSMTSQRASEIIKIHMDKVFMRMSNAQLSRVIEASRANRDIRRSDYFREMHEFVTEKTAELYKNTPEGKAIDMLSINDKSPQERAKMFDFLAPGFVRRFLMSKNDLSAANSQRVLESIDENRSAIMQVLAATISNDIELKQQVAKETIHGIRVRELGEGEKVEIGEVWLESLEGEIKMENTDDLRRRIRESDFRKKIERRTGTSWEDMDPDERESESYVELQEEGKLPKPRRGFFGLWLSSIFDSAFPEMKQKLANEFENE